MESGCFRICITLNNIIIVITANNHKYFYCLLFRGHYPKSKNKIKLRVLAIIFLHNQYIDSMRVRTLLFSIIFSFSKNSCNHRLSTQDFFFKKQIYKIQTIILMTLWLLFRPSSQHGFQQFMVSIDSAWSVLMIYKFFNVLKITYLQKRKVL